jgi:hypothetical protein
MVFSTLGSVSGSFASSVTEFPSKAPAFRRTVRTSAEGRQSVRRRRRARAYPATSCAPRTNRIALDFPAVAEVRSEMRTVCIEHAHLSSARAPNDEVASKVASRPNLLRLEFLAECNDEPASRETSQRVGKGLTGHRTMNVIPNSRRQYSMLTGSP